MKHEDILQKLNLEQKCVLLSGESVVVLIRGKTDAAEFEIAMTETYKDYDIKYWYNGNRTKDIAHDEHKELFDTVISEIPDKFVDGVNCCWIDFPGGSHAFNCWLPDLYNSLLELFK